MSTLRSLYTSNSPRLRDYILSLNPTAYYPLNEISGTTCFDIVGTRHGTYPASAILDQQSLLLSTQTSKSVRFISGLNTLINIPFAFTDSQFTIGGLLLPNLLCRSMIFQVSLSLSGNRAELGTLIGTANQSSRGNILLGISQNISFYNPTFVHNLGVNPVQVVMRLNSNTLSYFINGVKVIESNTSGTNANPIESTNSIAFGSFSGDATSDSINLSEVFFFNSALTDQQINDINSNRF
jgi:hypothetical protein